MTRSRVAYFFTVTFVFACSMAMLAGKDGKLDWRTGQLLAVTVQGHGARSGKRSVIWRNYCIGLGKQVYSAVSKRNPGEIDLEVNRPVRFAIAGKLLYVIDGKGKTHVLRNLMRGVNADKCAKTGVP